MTRKIFNFIRITSVFHPSWWHILPRRATSQRSEDPGTIVRIRTDEQNHCDKKVSLWVKKDRPQTYVLLKERGNKLARNRPHLVSTIKKFNFRHDYVNVIPASNTSTDANLMIDNQHKNPTLEDVYRTKFGFIVKKPKRYIDEMWYHLFLTFLQYVNKMLFDKRTYWRNVIWYDFNNF